MNIVDAVSKSEIDMISNVLAKKYRPIYADIWKVGLNLSLRISDLLSLEYSQINLDDKTIKMVEAKTGKTKSIRLNSVAIDIIVRRRGEYPDDVWLFQVHSNRAKDKPISRSSVSRTFSEVGDILGLNINTHTIRKSRGKAMYDDKVPLEMIAKVLNHSSTAETLRYIGITQEMVMKTYDDYVL